MTQFVGCYKLQIKVNSYISHNIVQIHLTKLFVEVSLDDFVLLLVSKLACKTIRLVILILIPEPYYVRF